MPLEVWLSSFWTDQCIDCAVGRGLNTFLFNEQGVEKLTWKSSITWIKKKVWKRYCVKCSRNANTAIAVFLCWQTSRIDLPNSFPRVCHLPLLHTVWWSMCFSPRRSDITQRDSHHLIKINASIVLFSLVAGGSLFSRFTVLKEYNNLALRVPSTTFNSNLDDVLQQSSTLLLQKKQTWKKNTTPKKYNRSLFIFPSVLCMANLVVGLIGYCLESQWGSFFVFLPTMSN